MEDYFEDDYEEDTQFLGPSKSQRKRDMLALQALGKQLLELSQEQFSKLILPERLHDAVVDARKINARGAHKRQLQYIGRLMREIDAGPVQEQLDDLRGSSLAATQLLHEVEGWRDRLLSDDAGQLERFIERCPDADRQYLRQLIRNAQKENAAGKPPKSARSLFRYVRELLQPLLQP